MTWSYRGSHVLAVMHSKVIAATSASAAQQLRAQAFKGRGSSNDRRSEAVAVDEHL